MDLFPHGSRRRSIGPTDCFSQESNQSDGSPLSLRAGVFPLSAGLFLLERRAGMGNALTRQNLHGSLVPVLWEHVGIVGENRIDVQLPEEMGHFLSDGCETASLGTPECI
jgi:hypothetical protein